MKKKTTQTSTVLIALALMVILVNNQCQDQGYNPPSHTEIQRGDHLLLGNPSNANNDPDNYLMTKAEFVLSYNRTRGTANWVAWHLNQKWDGNAERQNDFRPDPDLPEGWYRVHPNDYRNSGFDRGHLCPSADRDANAAENSATFLMTNIFPQAPNNNRGPWRELEEYARRLVEQGNELYIIAGMYGHGGTGSNGGRTKYLANKKIYVPAQAWKVILVLPEGENDLQRINANTRVIAIDMPNQQNVANTQWQDYAVSVDELERRTGYDFFSALPNALQKQLQK
ncbi:MAG: DNA/RNA non-specific endonuclease [Bernardetiaceae bacterium]